MKHLRTKEERVRREETQKRKRERDTGGEGERPRDVRWRVMGRDRVRERGLANIIELKRKMEQGHF